MKLTTLILLLAPCSAQWNWGTASDSGLIELDMQISHKPKGYHNNLGAHLMNLRSAGQDPLTKQYIEKNLYDYFNIQIFS